MVLIQESCGVWGSLRFHLGCMRGDGMPMSTSPEHMHEPSFQRPKKTHPINKSGNRLLNGNLCFLAGEFTNLCFASLF